MPAKPLVVWCLAGVASIGCRREADPAPASEADHSPTTARSVVGVDRAIRVLLAEGLDQGQVTLPERFDLRDPADGRLLAEDLGPQTVSVLFDADEIVFPRLERAFRLDAVDLVPEGIEPLEVTFGDGSRRRYRGYLRYVRRPDGSGGLVNVVDVEDYLIGVVSAELSLAFSDETFRAQAIASRTFVLYQTQRKTARDQWDVKATESSQVYVGLARASKVPQAARAVHATRGVVCTWDAPEGERIFCAYFSSQCGGTSQPVDVVKPTERIPPLAGGVACAFCRSSPRGRWGPVRLDKTRVTDRLRERYPRFASIGPIDRIEVTPSPQADRPARFRLFDREGGSIRLRPEDFRLSVDPTGRKIRSTWFRLDDEGEAFVLNDGRGFGHGIGLCQHGAEGMAREGMTAGHILAHYYPESKLARAY